MIKRAKTYALQQNFTKIADCLDKSKAICYNVYTLHNVAIFANLSFEVFIMNNDYQNNNQPNNQDNSYQNNNYQQPDYQNNYQQPYYQNNYQQPNYQNNYQPNYQPNYQNFYHNPEPPKSNGIKSLIFGILSIWFCYPIIGIIFAAIARNSAAPILRDYPYSATAKLAKAGKITGTVGLVFSIISTVIFALYILVYVALLGTLMSLY